MLAILIFALSHLSKPCFLFSQLDQDGALADKDAVIAQLQKEVAALRAKLAEAERKYQLLSNSSAADVVGGAFRAGPGRAGGGHQCASVNLSVGVKAGPARSDGE